MPKKTFYIILIAIAGLLMVGGLIWYLIFGAQQAAAPTGGAGFTVPGQNFPQGKLKAISNGPVISAHLNNNKVFFYDFSGELWQFNNGATEVVNQQPIKNLAAVIWKNTNYIIKAGIGQSDINYLSSDINSSSVNNLKNDIKAIAFSPDAKKIVYQIADNSKINALFTSNQDGGSQKTLVNPLKLRDIILNWPKTNQISLTSKPSGLIPGSVWGLDTRNLSFIKLLDGFFGLETLWSPDGNSFIFSYTDQNGRDPKLAFFDKKGNAKIINISTLVDKCVWANDSINIFCAVPKIWPDSAILPDDYYKNVFSTNDEIWKINTETEAKDLMASGLVNVDNLIADENENNLIFISRGNQFLYQLNLK
jgi:hypothetical protein